MEARASFCFAVTTFVVKGSLESLGRILDIKAVSIVGRG
jgi:hypothetical protein